MSYVSLGLAQLRLGQPRQATEIFERTLARMGPERRAAAWLPFARAQEFGEMPAGYRAEIGNLVSRVALTPPEGFDGIKALNAALAAALRDDPTLMWEPQGKATRKGGQTGLLLDNPREPFIRLRKDAAARHRRAFRQHQTRARPPLPAPGAAHLPDRPLGHAAFGGRPPAFAHPCRRLDERRLLRRAAAARWARARRMTAGSNSGHPPPEFDAKFEPRTIAYEPREGDALFFPSYLFHRTLPFSGDVQRISLAFDVKPTSWRD